MLKYLAAIQAEFLKLARKWDDLSYEQQRGYLSRHPRTKRRVTAMPPRRSPTSGLRVEDPHRGQSRDILGMLRDVTNAASQTPVWRKYVTVRNDRNNKYHYFGVFENKDGGFTAANVYGRIGYPPRGAVVLATAAKPDGAIRAAEAKLAKKMQKGYVPTKL